MATPSPTCEVKDGSGSWVSTTDGVDVTVGNTISIRLASTAGVDVWSIQCITTDETSTAPTLTVNYTTKVATFTAPAAGKALRFKSTVTSQSDKVTSSATFCIYTLTGSGQRVVAFQETTEGDSSFGWTARLNAAVRQITSSAFVTGPDTVDIPELQVSTYCDLTAGDVTCTLPASPAMGARHGFKVQPGTGGTYKLVIHGNGEYVEQFPDSTYTGAAPPSPPPTGYHVRLEMVDDADSVTLEFDGTYWVIV